MWICICGQLSSGQIAEAARQGVSAKDMHETLDRTIKCGACVPAIEEIVDRYSSESSEDLSRIISKN